MIVNKREAILGQVVLILMVIFTLAPIATLLSAALAPSNSLPKGIQWPSDPQWYNFVRAFKVAHVRELLGSSMLIVLGTVPVSLVIATLAGYALGNLRIRGGQFVFLLLVSGLTIPFESVVIPLYYEVTTLGFIDTPLAIILPLIGLFMPFSVIWMRAHFLGIPRELSEAAQIDGANTFQQLIRVQLPLARPALTALGILLFIWTWNQFLLALIMVSDPLKRTMAGALGAFVGQYSLNLPLLFAGALVIMAPTVVVYVIFQRQFIKALVAGAVKG